MWKDPVGFQAQHDGVRRTFFLNSYGSRLELFHVVFGVILAFLMFWFFAVNTDVKPHRGWTMFTDGRTHTNDGEQKQDRAPSPAHSMAFDT